MELLAQRLSTLRASYGWSLREVADSVGLGFNTIRRYETAESIPNALTVARLAWLYRTTPNKLLDGIAK
jgi:transcriptional regulator with XRE-family HTH domain